MIVQALLDGVLAGAIVALGAIGVSFSLSILRFANFSHGDLLALGAYCALAVVLAGTGLAANHALAQPIGPFSFGAWLLIGLAGALLLTVLVALVLDRWVYLRLRSRAADPLTLVFASFGLALLLRSVILVGFGPDPHQYSREIQMAVRLPGDLLVLPDQILVFGLTLAVLTLLWLFLQRSRGGLALRCMAESPALAAVAGIDPSAAVRLTWILSAALAALAGVLYGLTVQVRPEMGINLLLPLFTAAILGGIGSLPGAVAGALIISVSESLLALVLPGTYKPLVPFVLLIIVLYLRPQGLFRPAGTRH